MFACLHEHIGSNYRKYIKVRRIISFARGTESVPYIEFAVRILRTTQMWMITEIGELLLARHQEHLCFTARTGYQTRMMRTDGEK
jgi:hypothetical protein